MEASCVADCWLEKAGEAGRGSGRNTPPHAFMYILSRWRLGIFLPSNHAVLTYNPGTGFQVPLRLGMTIWVSWSWSTVAQWQSQLPISQWMEGTLTVSWMGFSLPDVQSFIVRQCRRMHACVCVCVCMCVCVMWKGRLKNLGAWPSFMLSWCLHPTGAGQRPLPFSSCSLTTQAEIHPLVAGPPDGTILISKCPYGKNPEPAYLNPQVAVLFWQLELDVHICKNSICWT